MTDLSTKPPPSGRGLRIALAVSVALNLAVLGVVGGALLGPDGPARGEPRLRDPGFGMFTAALTAENRADLRRRFIRQAPGFAQHRREMQAGLQALLVALRAEPFDAGQLEAAMQAQAQQLGDRLAVGQALIRDFLIDLAPDDRRAFADRLETSMPRHRKGRDDRGPPSGE